MNITIKYFLVSSLLSVFVSSCGHKNDNCLKARVVRITCASLVVQVLNKDSIGSYGWRDVRGNTVYNNVFAVKNSCDMGNWLKGQEFYFSIKDSSGGNDCIACKMYDAPPGKSYEIENVSRNCKNDD